MAGCSLFGDVSLFGPKPLHVSWSSLINVGVHGVLDPGVSGKYAESDGW